MAFMRSPESYFTDPREKELAMLAWRKGGELLAGNSAKSLATSVLLPRYTDARTRQLICASEWITTTRGDGEEGGTDDIHAAAGKPPGYFTPAQIGNVEHTYRAAFLSLALSPGFAMAANAGWDLVVDPLWKEDLKALAQAMSDRDAASAGKAYLKLQNPFKEGLIESYKRNGQQFTGPDYQGWLMGADVWNDTAVGWQEKIKRGLGIGEAARAFDEGARAVDLLGKTAQAKPKPPSPAPPAGGDADHLADYPVDRKGVMLSQVSQERYQTLHLWPLLWEYNKKIILGNPNRLPVSIKLKVPKLSRYSPAQIDAYKKLSPTWKNYPH